MSDSARIGLGTAALMLAALLFAMTNSQSPLAEVGNGDGARLWSALPSNTFVCTECICETTMQTGWNGWYNDPMSVFTLGIVLLTALLAISTIALWVATNAAARASVKAADTSLLSANAAQEANRLNRDTFIASERPWIKIQAALASGLVFDANGATVTLRFKVTNVGRSPARNVWIHSQFSIQDSASPSPNQKLKNMSDGVRMSPEGNLGHALFPGEEISQLVSMSILNEQINLARKTSEWMSPIIIGCVDYRFVFEGGSHQTGFVLNLHTVKSKQPGAVFAVNLNAGNVPIESLRLVHWIHGGHAD